MQVYRWDGMNRMQQAALAPFVGRPNWIALYLPSFACWLRSCLARTRTPRRIMHTIYLFVSCIVCNVNGNVCCGRPRATALFAFSWMRNGEVEDCLGEIIHKNVLCVRFCVFIDGVVILTSAEQRHHLRGFRIFRFKFQRDLQLQGIPRSSSNIT